MHPALFAGVYVVVDNIMILVQIVPPLRPLVLGFLPKAVQAVFAGIGDFYTWKLAEKIYGQGSNTSWAAV